MAGLSLPARRLLATAGTALLTLTTGWASAEPVFPAGTYFGLIQGTVPDNSGTVRATINRAGRGSLAIKLGALTRRIAVTGTTQGEIVATARHPEIPVRLAAVPTTANSTGLNFTGTIGSGPGAVSVTLRNATPAIAASTVSAAGLAGAYTVILQGPIPTDAEVYPLGGLAGIGAVRISTKGLVTFRGALVDGTQVTQTTTLDSSGVWTLYATAANGEALSGEVTFADTDQSDFSGAIEWQTPANSSSGAAETNTALQILGSRYDPTLTWDFAKSFAPVDEARDAYGDLPNPADPGFIPIPVSLALLLEASDDGGATASFSAEPVQLGDILIATGPRPMALIIQRATGLLFGGFRSASAGTRLMAGIAFQKTHLVFGLQAAVASQPEAAGALRLLGSTQPTGADFQRRLSMVLKSIEPGPAGSFTVYTSFSFTIPKGEPVEPVLAPIAEPNLVEQNGD
jgi:hypothetical protein